MTAEEILKKLDSGKYKIEHSPEEVNGKTIIVGALLDKENPAGFGRVEFALKSRRQQEIFLEGYQRYIATILG